MTSALASALSRQFGRGWPQRQLLVRGGGGGRLWSGWATDSLRQRHVVATSEQRILGGRLTRSGASSSTSVCAALPASFGLRAVPPTQLTVSCPGSLPCDACQPSTVAHGGGSFREDQTSPNGQRGSAVGRSTSRDYESKCAVGTDQEADSP